MIENYKYLVQIYVFRVFTPEDEQQIRWIKEYAETIPEYDDNSLYSKELGQYAADHYLRERDFTKKTNCIKITAHYYSHSLQHPLITIHSYVYMNDGKMWVDE